MIPESPRVLVAIPAYNEEDSVAQVVAEVRAAVPAATVLVVDDGSRDRTAVLAAAAGAIVVQLPFNVGVGGAMRTAFLYARDGDFDAAVQVDADGQHDPVAIPDLLAGLGAASVVIGARFAGRGDYTMRGPRRWAAWTLARSVSRVTGTHLTDTTSGFRAADRPAIAFFARHYPAEYLGDTVESLVSAARSGLPVAQVPVAMRSRRTGTPRQDSRMATMYLGRALLALFVALHGTSKDR